MIEITRKVEFDAGHRIPDHKSKCRNVHGHRYTLEATVRGVLLTEGSSSGMVQDFGDLKAIMMQAVGDPWDHSCLVARSDVELLEALALLDAKMPQAHRTVVLDVVPTVENLVGLAAQLISEELLQLHANAWLWHVRLYETPNCWADWYREGLMPRAGTTGL